MAIKRNYADFIKFAHKHDNLKYNDMEELYKSQGGVIRRQTGQQLIRKEFGFDKGEMRGKPIGEKLHSERAKAYVYVPPVKKKKVITPKKKKVKEEKPNKKDYIIFDVNNPDQMQILNRNDKGVSNYETLAKNLFGAVSDTYIQIGVEILGDDYTHDRDFDILYPFNGRKKQAIKQTGKNIISYLQTYYKNLSKLYTTKSNMASNMLDNLKHINTQLNKMHYMTKPQLRYLFASNGIQIKDFELVTFKTF